MIWAREAVPDDAAMLAPLLRTADRIEVERAAGDVEAALRDGIQRSRLAAMFFDGDEPLCVMGIVDTHFLQPGIGSPWLIGTVALSGHKKAFLRETRRWFAEIRKPYSLLFNYVDAEYSGAIRWLRWLGFTVFEPEPFGVQGKPFCRFEMRS
jgi:hypothetical protein